MAVAEIFLAAFLQGLVRMLTSQDLLSFARREKIHDLIMKWSRMLGEIDAVLADAEEKQMKTEQRGIKLWLEDLEDLAYDLDDILDEFSTEALRQHVLKESRASTSKVRALIPTCCTRFDPSTLVSDFRMRSKMDEMTKRLKDLFDRRTGLDLQIVDAGHSSRSPQIPPTSSLMHETRLYGRDGDQKAIIELLLRDQSNDVKVGVVPIVGMGGVGKTTLAQMVYNHEMVERHFEIKVWVCVSEKFDIMGVTTAILESIAPHTRDYKTLNEVQVQLIKALDGRKFLIVLDDVWNKNYGDWRCLKSPFNVGALGSKVIVTTRNRDVAFMMAGTDTYHHPLKELSEDDCWSVFAEHAFENRNIDESPNLVSLGRKIVKKCGGLPLAARTLGGLLRCKLRDDEWEDVLNSKMWELSDKESDILPALRLSYYHFPSHLKKCFGYCSVLPKDYEFEEKKLVFWWMAEGLIQKPTGHKQMEDLGCEYFRELLSRSFFQPSSSGEFSLFVMHDLINDLAQFVARRTYFRLDDMLQNNEDDKNIAKARHSSYIRGYHDGIKRFEAFRKAKNVRSFLPFGLRDRDTSNYRTSFLTSNVPLHLLPSLSRLRVRSLRRYGIYELSSSIGDLKHVRFLDLSCALIATLPESISTLYNLQTLMLRDCKNLNKLPATTSNLVNLRHLDVTGADSLQEMPPKIGELTCLQTLSNFVISQDEGSTINELEKLIHLRGTLCISGLENVADALDANRANLNDKQGLDVLLMMWSNISDNSRNEIVESEVLDMLRPHNKLKELTIIGYHGLTFPTWMGNSLFCNMVSLKFQNCENCISLPHLGQLPSLENLHIQGMKAVENIGLEFYGLGCSNPFPALQILTLEDMPEWQDWSHFRVEERAQAFIHLSELSIKRCPKLLGKLPENLPGLKKLEIEVCPLLVFAWVQGPTEPNQVRNMLQFEALISLSLTHVSILDSCNPKLGNEAMLENARCSHLSSLIFLTVENMQGLRCLPSWFLQQLTGVQELFIRGCQELTSLWKNDVRRRHRLPALRCLRIEECPQLISFCEEDDNKDNEEGLQQHEELPYLMMLEHLEITSCEKLENPPQGLHNLKYLQDLIIFDCPCLISFPKEGLPSTLTTLRIRYCDVLQSLPEFTMQNSLELLEVSGCPSLTYLSCSKTGLPLTLKSLWLDNCRNLESILAEEGMKINCPSLECVLINSCESLKSLSDLMQNNYNGGCLKNLRQLEIYDCDNLECIPEGWFTATNLRELQIYQCKKLKGLPYRVYNNLTSLQKLSVDNCASATGLVSYILNNAQFTNLTMLGIVNVDMGNKPRSEWGMHRLSSLTTLNLGRYSGASFPAEEKDGMMQWLPPSLTTLRIYKFPNLEKLYCKDFQNLPCLGGLQIWKCPKLTTITELGQLPSLSELWIGDCPNVESFSAEDQAFRLPPSLLGLRIYRCPLLKERCEKKKGQYWPLISHIPLVCLDGRPQDTMPQCEIFGQAQVETLAESMAYFCISFHARLYRMANKSSQMASDICKKPWAYVFPSTDTFLAPTIWSLAWSIFSDRTMKVKLLCGV
ncbi:putative disease resistance RPP13-like protein 1 [Rhododendron vialii]|uniref:putative disease resistance RPP13-like protein 1 n=1 Tax=Rhododendron vialii TaxID=182163 RepID=UPI00265EEE10|nr:putative disease resistance RPP13-like protein 1 [Rhododendron vialii]